MRRSTSAAIRRSSTASGKSSTISGSDTVNWADYANITGPLTREEPDGTYVIDPQLNFPPDQNYRTRSVSALQTQRGSRRGRGVGVIMYRITDQPTRRDDWPQGRGVPVRLITEQAQYRLVSRMWHSWNVDRLYMAGIEIRDRAHAGLNHQKSVIIYDQDAAAREPDARHLRFLELDEPVGERPGRTQHVHHGPTHVLVHRSVRPQVEQPGAGG